MLTRLLDSPALQMLRGALDGLSLRQEAISNNIANVDTVGYQRQTVNFENELKAALGRGGARLATSDQRHFGQAARGGSGVIGQSGEDGTFSIRNDVNNVDIDREMTDLVDTTLKYQVLAQTTAGRLRTLGTIIDRA